MSAERDLQEFFQDYARCDGNEASAHAKHFLDAFAHELAKKIQADMEEVRAADWGRSSRSKRPYLQGMERAKKAIDPEVSDSV